jgi:RHS repeat-associated protein
VAVAPDGSFYIADSGNNRIRRVGPDGIITTVAGNGFVVFNGDGGPATQAALFVSFGLAVAPDGSFYIADPINNRIRRVGPDGIITTVAGNGSDGGSGDGGPATQAELSDPAGVAVAPDGSFYIADSGNNRIRRVGPDGIISTVAGNGTEGGSGDGGPATQAALSDPFGVAVAPDGSFYVADPNSNINRIRRVALPVSGFSGNDIAVVSEDGGLLYLFDAAGRHLRTLDALTGATLFEFGYDAAGRLNQVTEKTGGTDNVTTILHDGAGNPTAMVGPFGQQTTLVVDANGFLASISNPAGEQMQFISTAGGLLTSYTDPRGKTSVYQYDADGRLIHDANPAGGTQTLARVAITDESTVTRTTTLNRVTTYKTENLPGNVQRRTITAPDGSRIQSEESIDDGTTHATSSNGTISDTTLGPDPRFGMQSPITASFSLQFPSTLQFTASSTRSAVLADAANPLSLVSRTDTTTVDGRTANTTYTAATRTFVSTTPGGRTQTSTVDSLGRLVQSQFGNLDPVLVGFDARSRLRSITNGSGLNTRSVSLTYNGQGFLDTIRDSIGRTARLGYDAAGRVTTKTLPDGRVVSLGYDAAGNLTSVTPPGRPAYTLGYSERNELTLFNPPAVPGSGPTAIAYDADGAVTNISRAGVHTISINYDAAGRPVTRKLTSGGDPTTTDTFSYDSNGRTTNVLAGSGVNFSYAYDGLLPVGVSWSGPVAGSVARTYDRSLRLASQSVNGTNTIAFSYDNDGLLTGAGDLVIVRDPQHGLAIGNTLGVVTSSRMFNGVGEMTNFTVTATASTLYSARYVRDGIGCIAQKVETIGGATDTYTYAYDNPGQLTNVVKNGAATESYAYDANGNRTNATVGGVTVNPTYDNQDRLTQSGTATFIYNGAGDLVSRTDGAQTTTYDYDPLGNLRGVTLSDGATITYLVDGLDRRVGRKVNGTLVQGLLYHDLLRPVAELDGAGAVVSRFVYSGGSVPAYLIKGGVSFRVIADQIGSVRLVVNASTGAIVQRLDYDSFGNVLIDTSPGFQPFGFAGGIYDPLTKIVRFGTRDYDPETGRWTAQDSIGFAGNDPNLYRYCHNDPVNLLDPAGLDNWDAVHGFMEQMNEEIAMVNPIVALNVLLDSAVKAVSRELGFDPGPTLREMAWHSLPTTADRKSEDYATGELAAVCVGIVGKLATGLIGEGVTAARLAAESETLARQGRIAERLASMQRPSFSLTEAAAAARNGGRQFEHAVEKQAVKLLKGWKTGGGGSGIGSGGGG